MLVTTVQGQSLYAYALNKLSIAHIICQSPALPINHFDNSPIKMIGFQSVLTTPKIIKINLIY